MFTRKPKDRTGSSREDLIYTDIQAPPPGEEQPDARRKRMRILIRILAAAGVLLVLSLILGGSIRHRRAQYGVARQLIEDNEYSAAMTALEALDGYRDSRSLLSGLEAKQAAYDSAMELLDQRRYDEATAAFRALGDYADSPVQAARGVTYRKALDLMAQTEAGQTQLLARILDPDVRITDEGGYAAILGYETAAALLESLGDYADAPARMEDCYLAAARVKLERKNWDGALAYMDRLSPDNAEKLRQDYLALCSDRDSMEDLIRVLMACDGLDTAAAATVALGTMEPYTRARFDNRDLRALIEQYVEGVTICRNYLAGIGTREDWYRGASIWAAAIDTLCADHGFLAGEPALAEKWAGWSDLTLARYELEQLCPSVATRLVRDGDYHRLQFTNPTGYGYTLVYTVRCVRRNRTVWESRELRADVEPYGTVALPTGLEVDAVEFDRCVLTPAGYEAITRDGTLLAHQD